MRIIVTIVPILLLIGCSTVFGSLPSIKGGRSVLNTKSATSLNAVDSFIASGAAPVKKGGEATISTSTFNLAKSIIGAGVLSLPSGVAFFSDEPSAILPASIICALMGALAGYSFSLIGRACDQHKSDSFQDAWAKSVNPKSAWMISAAITAKCFLASLAYSIIIGDSFTALAKTFNLPVHLAQRSNVIMAVTAVALLPLCSLKSLSALAPFSLMGLCGTLYTAIFMAIRYFDKSYNVGGKFYSLVAKAPVFSTQNGYALDKIPYIFVLVSMLSTSFIAHFNAPKFYAELKDTSMPKFNKVTSTAFGTAIITFMFMMSIGFLTFGGSSQGFILNNYASSDILATFARLAIGLALITGYPFTFSALKDGILDLQGVIGEARIRAQPKLTLGLLSLVTGLALVLKDVGFVVSFAGALFGCALMFMVPAYMNICNIKSKAVSGFALDKGQKLELGLNWGLIGTGFVMAILGVAISVMREFKML